MNNRLAMILCLITVFVVGVSVFFYHKTIDYMTIFHALKIIIPAGIVAYLCGYFLEKILTSSTSDTFTINKTAQRKYVDDLLLMPEQVLNSSPFIPVRASEEESVSENEVPNVENGDDSQEEFKII